MKFFLGVTFLARTVYCANYVSSNLRAQSVKIFLGSQWNGGYPSQRRHSANAWTL